MNHFFFVSFRVSERALEMKAIPKHNFCSCPHDQATETIACYRDGQLERPHKELAHSCLRQPRISRCRFVT
jgi:hypothetical protein